MDMEPSITTSETSEIKTNCSTKGSDDGEGDDSCSSIEALNWSDLEDYEDEDVDNGSSSSAEVIIPENQNESDDTNLLVASTSSSNTLVTSVNSQLDEKSENDKVKGTEKFDPPKEALRQRISKQKETNIDDIKGTVPLSSAEGIGDLSSNAAVLDDGPIWAKGSKKYRFEENTRINQKLTIGVILSVVLAIGLGLGNLVAYNECEAEHKVEKSICPLSTKSQQQTRNIPSSSIPTVPEIPMPLIPNPSFQVQRFLQSVIPTVDSRPRPPIHAPAPAQAPEIKPIDPQYSQHAEELSRVLKVLDELSRKIDQFENTTRELGGLFMMNDDEPNNESKKTKFVQALSNIMKQRSFRNPKNYETVDNINKIKTWKEQKEEVLDEIAGAVLEAMGNPTEKMPNNPIESLKEDTKPEKPVENTAPTLINMIPIPTEKLNGVENTKIYSQKSTKTKSKSKTPKNETRKNGNHPHNNNGPNLPDESFDKKKQQMKYSIPYTSKQPQKLKNKPQSQQPKKEGNWDSLRSKQREMFRRGAGSKHSFQLPGEYETINKIVGRDWQSERDKVRTKFRQKNKKF